MENSRIQSRFLNLFKRFRKHTEHLDYGRQVILGMIERHMNNDLKNISILDIGMGTATDLINIARHFANKAIKLYGVDSYEANVSKAGSKGIEALRLDIERQSLPFTDNFFDIVIINQVIEHTKELFFIFGEISRVIKTGGILIIGVPNLAAWHNRILLALGRQPTCIKILGPHVRGFTKRAFTDFITTDGYFEVLEVRGSNFYPFPPSISPYISRILPTFSISLFFLCRRTSKNGNFLDILNSRFFETEYYRGE